MSTFRSNVGDSGAEVGSVFAQYMAAINKHLCDDGIDEEAAFLSAISTIVGHVLDIASERPDIAAKIQYAMSADIPMDLRRKQVEVYAKELASALASVR